MIVSKWKEGGAGQEGQMVKGEKELKGVERNCTREYFSARGTTIL